MSFRQLIVAKQSHLSITDNKISVKQDEHINLIPLEDITIIIIDSVSVTFSSVFISECSKKCITILICGSNHMPTSVVTPINHHYRPFQVINFQIDASERFKDIMTEQLLKSKISNQIKVIENVNNDDNALQLLNKYHHELKGSDEINREGTAAKVFFNSLYGGDFVRFAEDNVNVALNYGYGVLRSSVTRYINTYGLCAYLGVKHCGKTNPFNLTYDLIEPFRPIVDYYVSQNIFQLEHTFPLTVRKELVNLLNASIEVNGKSVTVQYAIDLLVKSYLRALEYGDISLDLPIIKSINFDHLNEPI